jgi:hypothetical protein
MKNLIKKKVQKHGSEELKRWFPRQQKLKCYQSFAREVHQENRAMLSKKDMEIRRLTNKSKRIV